MVLDSQPVHFQFGMQIGNETTVSGVPFVWYDIINTLLPRRRVLSPALGSGWGAC